MLLLNGVDKSDRLTLAASALEDGARRRLNGTAAESACTPARTVKLAEKQRKRERIRARQTHIEQRVLRDQRCTLRTHLAALAGHSVALVLDVAAPQLEDLQCVLSHERRWWRCLCRWQPSRFRRHASRLLAHESHARAGLKLLDFTKRRSSQRKNVLVRVISYHILIVLVPRLQTLYCLSKKVVLYACLYAGPLAVNGNRAGCMHVD